MSAAATPATSTTILKQLWELHERRGTMATLSKHEQAQIRHTLTWIGTQHAVSVHEAAQVPYALARVSQAIAEDAIQMLQKADIRCLSDFAASLGVPVEKPRGRR